MNSKLSTLALTPSFQSDLVTLYHASAEDVIPHLARSGVRVDAIIADPPYCSGGTAREATAKTPSQKYVLHGVGLERACFAGDNRDQRALGLWCQHWLRQLLTVARPPCYVASFIDRRNLAMMTDAVQISGWRYTDLLPWDKGEGTRPQKGWFRGSQAEYVVIGQIGTRGREQARSGPCLPGVLRCTRKADDKAHHMHGKPVEILKTLLGPLTGGDASRLVVFDPFCGSGSLMLAASALGIRSIGCDQVAENIGITISRLKSQQLHNELFPSS